MSQPKSQRRVKVVRDQLGARLRALRKERRSRNGRALSQERLGEQSGLSGKFIGEVERGEKSISVDSLYRVASALDVPLRDLTDLSAKPRDPELDRVFALLARQPRKNLTKAHAVVRALFSRRTA